MQQIWLSFGRTLQLFSVLSALEIRWADFPWLSQSVLGICAGTDPLPGWPHLGMPSLPFRVQRGISVRKPVLVLRSWHLGLLLAEGKSEQELKTPIKRLIVAPSLLVIVICFWVGLSCALLEGWSKVFSISVAPVQENACSRYSVNICLGTSCREEQHLFNLLPFDCSVSDVLQGTPPLQMARGGKEQRQ